MESIAEIRNLSKRFGRTVAVRDLSLVLPAGQVTAFLGPNGAGKTTTIKCLLNLLTPSKGTSSVLGTPSSRLGPDEFQQIGYVSENQQLPLWMTVRQFIDYCRPMYPQWDTDLEKRLWDQFGLPSETKLKSLSRGMRVKAALLSSLAYRPQLLVLDEPFSGLDPLVRDEFIEGTLELAASEGWSALMSSHDIEDVERLADRVTIIDDGSLQIDESVEDLQLRFRQVEITRSSEAGELPEMPSSWLNVSESGRLVRFTDSGFDQERLAADIATRFPDAKGHTARPMSLREIFVSLARTYRLRRNEDEDA